MNNPNINQKILAPNVHFLAFNLQESEVIQIKSKRRRISKDWLWETCNNIVSALIQKQFNIKDYLDLTKEPNSFYVKISNTNTFDTQLSKSNKFYIQEAIPFTTEAIYQRQSLLLEGSAYPVRINNSYALWLNIGVTEIEVDVDFLHNLNPNNCFFSGYEQGHSGNTIMLTAWLPPEDLYKDNESLEKIAYQCLTNFFPSGYKIPPFNRGGELFGSPIFQYGFERELPSSGNIFVCFFRSYKTQNQFHQSYSLLLKLFFYRAQIIKNFQQIKRNSRSVEKIYTKIVGEINSLFKLGKNNSLSKDDLNELQFQLKRLSLRAYQYQEFKAALNVSKNKIDYSINKYINTLEKLKNQFEYEDLNFLETIVNINWPFYQERIEASILYFENGTVLIDSAISSIRGQLAIEQTELSSRRLEAQEENDRTLQRRITALGFGLSVGGILSQIIANEKFAPSFLVLKTANDTYYITATIFCVIVGFICAFVVDILFARFQK